LPETPNNSESHENNRKRRRDWFWKIFPLLLDRGRSRWAFNSALAIIVAWAAVGPYYHYSDTWQLLVNTGTTIMTFIMIFLIQNTQNRDARAINLKVDEIILSIGKAKNDLINIEKLSDEELDKLASEYEHIRQ
jgi:low affinity Fe/Cu permease